MTDCIKLIKKNEYLAPKDAHLPQNDYTTTNPPSIYDDQVEPCIATKLLYASFLLWAERKPLQTNKVIAMFSLGEHS